MIAQWNSEPRARRPKVAKLAESERLRTSDYSIAEIAEEIASVVHPEADEQAGA